MTYKEKDEEQLKAAIYVRVSGLEQKLEGHGIDVQIRNCLQYIEKSGYIFAGGEKNQETSKYIYRDEAVSGAKDFDKREGAERLLNDLKYSGKKKPFDILIVWKIDRLARSISVLYDVVDNLKEHNVTFASSTEHFDMETPFGRMAFGILGLFAAFERDVIQMRTSEGTIEAKYEGMIQKEKYGYKKDEDKHPVEYPKESKIIKKIFDLFVSENKSIAEIARILTQEKIVIPTISKIDKVEMTAEARMSALGEIKHIYNRTDKVIRDYLQDEFYIGKYYFNIPSETQAESTKKQNEKHRDFVEGKGILSAFSPTKIIDKEAFDIAQKKIKGGKKRIRKNLTSGYLLSGLLFCDDCKNKRKRRDIDMLNWNGKPATGKGRSIYLCRGKASDRYIKKDRCSVLPLDADDLEKLVLLHIKEILNNPSGIKKLIKNQQYMKQIKTSYDKQKKQLMNSLIRNERSLKNNHTAFVEGEFCTEEIYKSTEETLLKEKENLRIKLIDLEKKIDSSLNIVGYTEGIKKLKKLLDKNIDDIFNNEEQAKILLEYLVDKIVVIAGDVPKGTTLPGVKRSSGNIQRFPYLLEIYFKLPQDIMNDFLEPYVIDDNDGEGGNTDISIAEYPKYVKLKRKSKTNNLAVNKLNIRVSGDKFKRYTQNIPSAH